MIRHLLALAATAVFLVAASAAAAAPAPFGHFCQARDGVRVCPTVGDTDRVPAWDGVPLDVDVTLPAAGDGPFPTLVMLHGPGADKLRFQRESAPRLVHRSAGFYARRGYAVVTHSARGFGRSCGVPSSRTPDCARGWTHLADQRYEARDTQELLGRLVDEGVARPGALGVMGEATGGLQALQLAHLRNRVRLADGRWAIWRSPLGRRRLAITAAWATWAGHDLLATLLPNGRLLDFRPSARGATESRAPLGVPNRAALTTLLGDAARDGFVAPAGADPQADLRNWQQVAERGEPFGPAARSIAAQLVAFHSASALGGTPAPLLLQSGWADDILPLSESLRAYGSLRHGGRAAPVSLQVLDTGLGRGGSHPNQELAASDQAATFFDAHLRRRGRGPGAGAVLAYTDACPRTAAGGRRVLARSWAGLHPGAVRFYAPRGQRVTSAGGDPATAAALDPASPAADACRRLAAVVSPGTAIVAGRARGFTLLGRPTVRAFVAASGPFGQLDSRLWDVAPDGTQTLVTRGTYRLTPGQRGTIRFQLNGGGHRFPAGHTVKLELLGADPPYLRPSNGVFGIALANVTLELPVLERPRRAPGVLAPVLAVPAL